MEPVVDALAHVDGGRLDGGEVNSELLDERGRRSTDLRGGLEVVVLEVLAVSLPEVITSTAVPSSGRCRTVLQVGIDVLRGELLTDIVTRDRLQRPAGGVVNDVVLQLRVLLGGDALDGVARLFASSDGA